MGLGKTRPSRPPIRPTATAAPMTRWKPRKPCLAPPSANGTVNSNTHQSHDWLQEVISFWPCSDRSDEPAVTLHQDLDQQVKTATDQAEEIQRVLELDGRSGKVICPLSSDFFDPNAKRPRHLEEAWNTIRNTKRINWTLVTNYPRSVVRQVPTDWDAHGYQNVCIAVTLPPSAEAATSKIANLRNVPCHWRAVFVDTAAVPLDLEVDLDAIDWVVVTGDAIDGPDPDMREWTTRLESKCRGSGIAFFSQGHNSHHSDAMFNTKTSRRVGDGGTKEPVILLSSVIRSDS